jgi:hypothetical protein
MCRYVEAKRVQDDPLSLFFFPYTMSKFQYSHAIFFSFEDTNYEVFAAATNSITENN